MLERFSHRLSLLTSGARDAPLRQQSLRACVAWSVDLLDDAERRALGALSVFVGGATMEAAENVLHAGLGLDAWGLLDNLVAKSLLVGGPRLSMLDTIREYASELLEVDGARRSVEAAHAAYYHHRYAADADLLPWPPRTWAEAHAWYEDLPNVRAALTTLLQDGRHSDYSDLVIAFSPLCRKRGLWQAWSSHLDRLLDLEGLDKLRRVDALVVSSAGFPADTRRRLEEADELLAPDASDQPVRCYVLNMLRTHYAFVTGESEVARASIRRAEEAARLSGSDELVAEVGVWRLLMFPDPADDLKDMIRTLETVHELGNQFLERSMLGNLSEIALSSKRIDDLQLGITWGREAYRFSILEEDPSAEIQLSNPAAAALLCGEQPEKAARDLRSSLLAAHEAGDNILAIENLLRLGAAEAAAGNHELASRLYTLWKQLRREHDIGIADSNQRLIDNYFPDADADHEAEPEPATLAEAVDLALGINPDSVAQRRTRA